jgi:hypothetical protein
MLRVNVMLYAYHCTMHTLENMTCITLCTSIVQHGHNVHYLITFVDAFIFYRAQRKPVKRKNSYINA